VPLPLATQLDYCSYCPKMCRHACPVATSEGRETFTPQAKMDRLNQIRRGRAPWTVASTDALWACTGCRHCTVYCDHGNEPSTALFAGRAEATLRGVGHPSLAGYPDRFRARDARLGRQLREQVPHARFADDAVVGFWPGCDAIDKRIDDVIAALSLFDRVGADQVRMVDAAKVCGGYPLLAAGYLDMFRWHAGKVASELKRYKTVITNCSACVHTLRALYPAEGVSLNVEVLHLSEFLAQHVDRIPEPRGKRATVYYHDPCYLARHAGVLEAPRRVLARVADVRELAWSRTDTECCGGAGVLPKTMPSVADGMARRRLGEVARKGGGMVVTACATCAFMLDRNAPGSVTVRDLPGAVASAVLDAEKQR
jgi:Fe-S oxidoreductase